MTRSRMDGLYFLLIGSVIFLLFGLLSVRFSPVSMDDFKAMYYGARCMLHRSDPYKVNEMLESRLSDGGKPATASKVSARVVRPVDVCVNPPTSLLAITPFALLPWGAAQLLWMILTAGSMILSAFLMWSIGADYAPVVSGILIGFLLANSPWLLMIGNPAGVAISFCVIAVWCFMRQRFVPVGVLCLSLSLLVRPHDAGLVWLYFLLGGRVYRKRALQALLLSVSLGLPGILWMSQVAPNWAKELHSNLSTTMMHGDINDPSPASATGRSPDSIIDLQTVISVFWDDPRIYNPVSYLICGAILLSWVFVFLRASPSSTGAWLALAIVASLSTLPLYHRQHDALLLLTIPVCAMLWSDGTATGKIAFLLTSTAVVLNGDLPSMVRAWYALHLLKSPTTFFDKILTVVLARPVPLAFLALGIFYLWIYAGHSFAPAVPEPAAAKDAPFGPATA